MFKIKHLRQCRVSVHPSAPQGRLHFPVASGTKIRYYMLMKRKHRATLELIFARPVSGSVRWADIEALLVSIGAEVSEREGSRIAVVLFGEVRVFHRPHPSPDTDKGALASVRKWLETNKVTP